MQYFIRLYRPLISVYSYGFVNYLDHSACCGHDEL